MLTSGCVPTNPLRICPSRRHLGLENPRDIKTTFEHGKKGRLLVG